MVQPDAHEMGMPVWIDVLAGTSEQREALMAFYTSVFGWDWDEGGEEIGYYCVAHASGRAVMGLGEMPGSDGLMVTYFSTDDIESSTKKAADDIFTQLGAVPFLERLEAARRQLKGVVSPRLV